MSVHFQSYFRHQLANAFVARGMASKKTASFLFSLLDFRGKVEGYEGILPESRRKVEILPACEAPHDHRSRLRGTL